MKDRWREKNRVMEFSVKLLVSRLKRAPLLPEEGPEEPRTQNFMARSALGSIFVVTVHLLIMAANTYTVFTLPGAALKAL